MVENMNNKFFRNFAILNIKKNAKMIIPFILTSSLTVSMLYNINYLAKNDITGTGNLSIILNVITYLIALFSLVFLFYTNSFLTKRRKKEFGLYNVLGLEKKHIARIIFIENNLIGFISITLGLTIGILFSRLMIFILYKVIHFDLHYEFQINVNSLLTTIITFIGIFTLISISNTIAVYKTNTIKMLNAEKIGETAHKTDFILIIIGFITIIAGYTIALSIEDIVSAMGMFFIAVILVSIATFCFFTAISTLILKAIKKNKSFYYKPENFIAISSLLFRIKKNAMGLTVITVLSTGIIILLSTTSSMYAGFENILDYRYSHDIKYDVLIDWDNKEEIEAVKSNINAEFTGIKDMISYPHFQAFEFENGDIAFYTQKEDGSVSLDGYTGQYARFLVFMTEDGYNQITGENISLNKNEVITSNISEETINMLDMSLKNILQDDTLAGKLDNYNLYNGSVIVLNLEDFNYLYQTSNTAHLRNSIYFNLEKETNVTSEKIHDFAIDFGSDLYSIGYYVKADNVLDFYSIYGTLFFCGIFLSVLFIISILLIIYYKQLIEGYEDREEFAILKKIGMSDELSKKSINKQIVMMFLLPVIAGSIHTAFAFTPLTKILALLNLTNVNLFLIITILTILIFFVFYIVMYLITSKVYRKIVR